MSLFVVIIVISVQTIIITFSKNPKTTNWIPPSQNISHQLTQLNHQYNCIPQILAISRSRRLVHAHP